jgi:hypothetical protein
LISGNTNWTTTVVPGAFAGTAADLYHNPSNYFGKCKWDLFEVDFSNVVLNSWLGMDFADADALYTFIRANFTPHPFTPNTAAYHGYIKYYDEIDETLPRIDKIWGINTFFSMLKGRRSYRHNYYSLDVSRINWSQFPTWFDDLGNQSIGFGPGHTFNPNDEKAIWVSRNDKKVHGLPVPGFQITPGVSGGRYIWDWGSSDFAPISMGSYENAPSSGSRILYSSLYLPTRATWSWWTNTQSSFMSTQAQNCYSTVVLYALEHTADPNHRAIMLKPLGIDRLGLNWFDSALYDLYALYSRKNYSPIMRRITSIGLSGLTNDLRWIERPQWDLGSSRARLSKSSVGLEPDIVQFYLRDKTSKKISRISEARVVRAQRHRDAPYSYEVQRWQF